MIKRKRYPLNSEGDFYVEDEICLMCDAPRSEAPELMEYDENSCYFKRQPETPEELEHAVNACRVSCIEAVRYAGDDPKILGKFSDSAGSCDFYEKYRVPIPPRTKVETNDEAKETDKSWLERFFNKLLKFS